MKHVQLVSAPAALLLTFAVGAQEVRHENHIEIVRSENAGQPERISFALGGDGPIDMVGMAGPVVKGAPYSAESVTESTRTLADGTRISKKQTAQVYRDSQGRTRRDFTVGSRKFSFVHDPAANTSYSLDESARTARKLPGRTFMIRTSDSQGTSVIGQKVDIVVQRAEAGTPEPLILRHTGDGKGPSRTEQLGKQTIEGVVCDGTRTITEIPTGTIGNDRPIQVVTEGWYSPELQTVVMSKHTNPMSGDNTFQLLNIRRSEPAATLFEVPSDYSVTTDRVRQFRIEKKQ